MKRLFFARALSLVNISGPSYSYPSGDASRISSADTAILSAMVRTLSFFILIVFLPAIFVSAQDEDPPPPLTKKTQKTKTVLPSLKTLPAAKRFADPARTFSLWMPAKPAKVTVSPQPDPQKGAARTRYTWILTEGFFAISKSVFAQRTFDTNEDIASIVTPLKAGVSMDPDMKLSSEKTISLGKWRGTELVFDESSTRTFMRVLARGKEIYVLVATVNVLAPNTEKLIVKAMNSFRITTIAPHSPGNKPLNKITKKKRPSE